MQKNVVSMISELEKGILETVTLQKQQKNWKAIPTETDADHWRRASL